MEICDRCWRRFKNMFLSRTHCSSCHIDLCENCVEWVDGDHYCPECAKTYKTNDKVNIY